MVSWSNVKLCSDCSIRKFGICSSLNSEELREFSHLGRWLHFADGETVISEQQIASSFLCVLDGVVRLYKRLPDRRRQIVGFALPGDIVGMNIADRHCLSADAVGCVTVCELANAPFLRFSENKPHLCHRINELTNHEINRARDHMILLGQPSAEQRLASFLLGWRERLVPLDGASNTVCLPMTRLDIADYLGLTIGTVSRTFTKLKRERIIEIVRGDIILLDMTRIESLTQKPSVSHPSC